jgi:hypothetical protein
MKLKVLASAMGLAVALLLTASQSFAHSWIHHNSSERATSVTIDSPKELGNGAVLPAGSYNMEVSENSQNPEVMFYKDGKLVCKTQAKLVTQSQKNAYTEVDSTKLGDKDVIQEIRPSGWDQSLVFSSAGGETPKPGQ